MHNTARMFIVVMDAHNDTVWAHKVVDCVAFFEKLRIAHNMYGMGRIFDDIPV